MERNRLSRTWTGLLWAICTVALFLATNPVLAEGVTWVDEIGNVVAFEQATYSGSNFDPYFEKLGRIRNDIISEDHLSAKTDTDQFLKMLTDRSPKIPDVAADEIYHFALQVRPTEEPSPVATKELGMVNERPMSVPDHTINTPYEGGPKCPADGCDYWNDDVFDPGAS